MASITKLLNAKGEISFRAQVRLKRDGKIVFSEARTFPREKLAKEWASKLELSLKAEGAIEKRKLTRLTLGELCSRYIEEMTNQGTIGRTKLNVIEGVIARPIGEIEVLDLSSSDIVEHCRNRKAEGASPATVAHDVSYIKGVLEYARSIWGLGTSGKMVDEAMGALHQQQLIGKSQARSRRPSPDELAKIDEWLAAREEQSNAFIPHVDLRRFAVASGMRAAEIERLRWDDLDEATHCIKIRERKDPKKKATNDQLVPLLGEAWDIVIRQPRVSDRIFPYNIRSTCAAFQRAVIELGIPDLRWHDLRHEGISRLFEQGLKIQEVALVSGHRSWSNLRRYTQLKPEDLHEKVGKKIRPTSEDGLQLTASGKQSGYFGNWSNKDDVLRDFELRAKDVADTEFIFAAGYADRGACVVFLENGELYEVIVEPGASLDWLPELTTINSLRHRSKTNRLGWHSRMNLFAKELLATLDVI